MILQKTTDFLFRNLQQDLVSAIKKNTVASLEIYPNPSNGNFNIVLPKTHLNSLLKMEIADITGKIVFSKMMLPNEFHTMNLSLENGMYVVSLFAEDQVYVTKLNVVK
ncbi:MAG: T9SS type A sorting domain-containing protein [Chitinophagales bacterium]